MTTIVLLPNSSYVSNNVTAILEQCNTTSLHKEHLNIFHHLVSAGYVISIICMILIFYVYIVLKETNNLHGKIILSFMGCLIASYLLLGFDFYLRQEVSLYTCKAIGILLQVSILATAFWCNITAYDVWNTLSAMRLHSASQHSYKYLQYSVYAWTSTIALAVLTVILDNTNLLQEKYRPLFGKWRCWLSSKIAFQIYFLLPIALLLLCNAIIFILTMKILKQVENLPTCHKVKQYRNRFHLYLKLFLVMGLIWMCALIPWFVGIFVIQGIADILSALQGLFLFFIFVCKKKTFHKMRNHFQRSTCKKKPGENRMVSLKPTFRSYVANSNY